MVSIFIYVYTYVYVHYICKVGIGHVSIPVNLILRLEGVPIDRSNA